MHSPELRTLRISEAVANASRVPSSFPQLGPAIVSSRFGKTRKWVLQGGASSTSSFSAGRQVNEGRALKNLTQMQSILTHGSGHFSWHAIYTRHQHEHTISQILLNKGFEVFLPVYECVRQWKDRRKTLLVPLFPCYVFVRGEMSRRQQILTTPGVHTILSTGEGPAEIPASEIESIRRAMQVQPNLEPHPFLTCGERVRVIRGSLSGVEGILLRKKGTHRLILSVEMLAQSASVEIDAFEVEPVTIQSSAITAGDGYSVRV